MLQKSLFHRAVDGPPGFLFQTDFITPEEERKLLKEFERIPLHQFRWDGWESKRRVKSYTKETGYPTPLMKVLERVAEFAKVKVESFEHAMVAEYPPGTQIGWHRDKGGYSKVIGISLGSTAVFRLRKITPNTEKRKWERFSLNAEPRSLYIMAEDSMRYWQHSIPPVKDLRYSITMRTVE
jgi:alkylated DNA repair dioxygenase AlkB